MTLRRYQTSNFMSRPESIYSIVTIDRIDSICSRLRRLGWIGQRVYNLVLTDAPPVVMLNVVGAFEDGRQCKRIWAKPAQGA